MRRSNVRQGVLLALVAGLVGASPFACTREGEDTPDETPDAGTTQTPDAGTTPDGGTKPKTPENTDEACGNGVDDDGNNFKDCADFGCLLGYDVTVCSTPLPVTVAIEDLQRVPATAKHPAPTDRRATPPVISKVELRDVVVTSPVFTTSSNPSFFVANPGENAAPWSGLFVYAPGYDGSAEVGTKVTLKGTYEEFNGASQVTAQIITSGGTGALPAAAPVKLGDLSDAAIAESWAGSLVKLEHVRVSAINVATDTRTGGATDDFTVGIGERQVAVGALILGSAKSMPQVGDYFESITGFVHYTYGRYRLQPRAAADLVKGTPPADDLDIDDVKNADDDCPTAYDPDQHDGDADGAGDACDVCPAKPDADQADTDHDGVGDACDVCPAAADADQKDFDHDGKGDACDDDIDGDTVPNASDNCPRVPNQDQADADHDGKGDACAIVERPASKAGDLIVNEVLADPPVNAGDPTVGDANKDGARDATKDEFVELVNATSDLLDLSGVNFYRKSYTAPAGTSAPCTTGCFTDPAAAGAGELKFTFPAGTKLAPGKAVVVFGGVASGKTLNAADFGGSQPFASPAGLSLGDTSYLVVAAGSVVLDKLAFTGKPAENPQVTTTLDVNNMDTSAVRSPEVTGTTWVKTTDVANHAGAYTPGTKSDGTAF